MKNLLKTYFLLAVLTGLLITIGSLIADQFGVMLALFLSFFINFFSYWYSDKIVLSMYKAKQVKDNSYLNNVVTKLVKKTKIESPKLYLIDSKEINAFATGRNEKHASIAVTSGLLKILTEDELEAVLAHEITHIKNNDILIGSLVAVIATAIVHIASMGKFALFFGGLGKNNKDSNIFSTILLLVFAPVVAALIQYAISRSREYLADKGSKEIIGTPNPLVSALRKIERTSINNQKSFVAPESAHMFIYNSVASKDFLSLFSTHPSVKNRVQKLLYED